MVTCCNLRSRAHYLVRNYVVWDVAAALFFVSPTGYSYCVSVIRLRTNTTFKKIIIIIIMAVATAIYSIVV